MISLLSARRLKQAGLNWVPQIHDFFAIPDRDLDDHVFVISEVQVTIDMLMGKQVVSFQGASEWALDSLIKDEAIWLPREDQLRSILEEILQQKQGFGLLIRLTKNRSYLTFRLNDDEFEFSGMDASDIYAQAILFLLNRQKTNLFE